MPNHLPLGIIRSIGFDVMDKKNDLEGVTKLDI